MYVCRIAISKSKTTKGCCVCIFIVMTADDLVTGGPRASANITFSEKNKKKYVYCCFSASFSNTKPMNVFCNCSLNLLKDKDKMQSLQLQCCDCWCTGDGYNWGICRHNVLSGTFITSETVMYVDTALLKKAIWCKICILSCYDCWWLIEMWAHRDKWA